MPRRKIAIIGSGCSGMAAAWALRNSKAEIHIFEKSPRLGGHTNTQTWQRNNLSTSVDTGFIVLNTATYPNFIRFLQEIEIEPVETEMTFGVSRDHGKFEWSGEPRGIFAQRRNLFRFRHWHLLFDIVRFNHFALDILTDDAKYEVHDSDKSNSPELDDISIGEYLDQHGYSTAFRDDYLIPMTAAVWSTSPDKANLAFPAKTLIRFMWNHHLLTTLSARPAWLTIPGGAQRYIDAIVEGFPTDQLHLHLSCEVTSVLRPTLSKSKDKDVLVSWVDSTSGRIGGEAFTHVIFACHGDQILPILTGSLGTRRDSRPASNEWLGSQKHDNVVSETELDVLSSFETSPNVCYLHSDLSLMPKRRATWTSWNYLTNTSSSSKRDGADVSLTYNMNILQHIPVEKFGHVLVTMNPDSPPDPKLTQGKFDYRHPLYTSKSVRAQRILKSIQNVRGVSYCGAWTNYGFHEDAFSSGLRVALDLGAELPFQFVDSTFSRGHRPLLSTRDRILRLFLLMISCVGRITQLIFSMPGLSALVRIISVILGAMLDVLEHSGFFE